MSDYLNELRDSARQVVEGAGTAAPEDTTWPLIVELGWLLTRVPEDQDGLGLGVLEAGALHTELGKGLNQAPFLPAMMAIEALVQSTLADKADWIGRFTSGDMATASLGEPCIALQGSLLSGIAGVVQSADKASHVLLWTSAEDCVVLVELQQSGVEVVARETWDTTRRLFDVKLNNLALDNQLVIASGTDAAKLIARLRTLRDFALAADSLGGGNAILELTVEHLRTRRQFGRPLALFQALKHRCADLKNILAAAEALLNDSLLRLADDIASPEAQLAAKKAKYLACATYAKVTEEALQLSGGIGMAEEYPCHLYLKRSMLNEHLGAGEEHYPAFIADQYLASLA
jgi:alkylation response protein AidB-like acyl-CoA dehydrogenase